MHGHVFSLLPLSHVRKMMRMNGQIVVENERVNRKKSMEVKGKAETKSKVAGMRITTCEGTRMECF
jgi:hypothetical protein